MRAFVLDALKAKGLDVRPTISWTCARNAAEAATRA
jgi:hypothetical protein